jgi:phenylpropionate dioxygenase-like ring-hydroxylating dioxygenase large terminal subunit
MLGEDLIAFRDTSNHVGLLGSHCPHRGTSLFFGRNEENGLRCSYHGWKFDRTGQCVDTPNEPPESNFKNKIQHTAYPCQERAGLVWAYLGPKELHPELPELEWMLVPESHRSISKVHADCNYLQAMEGDCDNSHAAVLHSGLAGPLTASLKERMVASRRVGRVSAGSPFAVNRLQPPKGELELTDYGIMMGWRRDADNDRYLWRINHWLMPVYSLIPGGGAMWSVASWCTHRCLSMTRPVGHTRCGTDRMRP